MGSSTHDATFKDQVRSRLASGTSTEQARRLRQRLVRNTLLASLPLMLGALEGQYRHPSIYKQFFLAVVAIGLPLASIVAYRRLRPGMPQAFSEADVDAMAGKSDRCPGCGVVVLPAERGECLSCGRLVKPIQTVLAVAVCLGVIFLYMLWQGGILGR